jgi:predicted dithiol-disulfide oxidoreductase (DUF899 family)
MPVIIARSLRRKSGGRGGVSGDAALRVVYHTYTRMAPDRDFVVPYYHQLLDRTPKGRVDEFRAFRHDEYANGAG